MVVSRDGGCHEAVSLRRFGHKETDGATRKKTDVVAVQPGVGFGLAPRPGTCTAGFL